ncbi:MAG TPA: sugar phosphate nucleotidyltransferase [Chitinophagaceae bacterium]|nr:sugar phosphate nucleotidyltransferase [Chitinophagaceae bacterium]
MQAFVLSAGMGSRLYPITKTLPKPLVEVQGQTLLERNLLKLKTSGYSKIIINLHFFPQQIIDFLEANSFFGLEIQWVIEKELLETGGGVKNALQFIDSSKPLTIVNADILSNIDLIKLHNFYIKESADAVLAIKNRNSSRKLIFNDNGELKAWTSIKENKFKPSDYMQNPLDKERAFSGIQIVNPELFEETKLEGKFSLIDLYIEQSKTKRILGWEHNADYLLDVGTIDKLQKAQHFKL